MNRNINQLKAIFNFIIGFVYSKKSPIGYARSLGVKLGSNLRFYIMKPHLFSTEPWLISVGNSVHIMVDCSFITHDGGTFIPRDQVPDLELTAPINIGNNVYLGIRSIIMPGVSIGNNVIIDDGSIVTKDFPDNTIAVRVPARVIKTLEDYLKKASANSLKLGHLKGEEKATMFKNHFSVKF